MWWTCLLPDDIVVDVIEWLPNTMMSDDIIMIAAATGSNLFTSLEKWSTHHSRPMHAVFSFQRPMTLDELRHMFGPPSAWNTSHVTSTEHLFFSTNVIPKNIKHWDVSHVTRMRGMFIGQSDWNESLEGWNTSNVINMAHMFVGCSAFNQPLDHWDTSNVVNMTLMFLDCHAFNQPLHSWNIKNVMCKDGMFKNCHAFDEELNGWKKQVLPHKRASCVIS